MLSGCVALLDSIQLVLLHRVLSLPEAYHYLDSECASSRGCWLLWVPFVICRIISNESAHLVYRI